MEIVEHTGKIEGIDMEFDEVGSVEVNTREQGTVQQDDTLIPGLPDEIRILCLARVPRSYHHNLKVVCQSWRTLLHGRVFSMVRRELSLAEEWLYLWMETGDDACQEVWYCFDPLLKKWWKLPAMPHDNRIVGKSAFASLDGRLFVIGGSLLVLDSTDDFHTPCRTVSYFDTRKYCWQKAADLNIARANCMVGVIGNQLYVFGGYMDVSNVTTVTGEVYDPDSDTWKLVCNMKFPMAVFDGVVLGGKFHVVNSGTGSELKGIVYDAHTDEWEDMADGLNGGWRNKTTALNGKLYTVGNEYVAGRDLYLPDEPTIDEVIQVYNSNKDVWEAVEEFWVNNWLMFRMCAVELVSLGGKICILCIHNWGETVSDGSTICMVVFEIRESGETITFSMVSIDEFEVQYTDNPDSVPEAVKRCQVVAL